MNTQKWLNNNIGSLAGKTIVVTGATGGLGEELCTQLASLEANLVLACRNENLAQNLKSKILQKYPNIQIDFVELDLSNMQSVDACIEKLNLFNKIDIIIHNAGVYNVPVKKLDTGYNNIFQINFVAPYYLTKKLLPSLRKSPNAKVVIVSSIAHNYSKINEKDIDFSTHKKSSKIYGNSKRYLTFAMYELFKNVKDVELAVTHPGITLTNMTNHYPKAINWLVKIGIKILFPSPQKAVLNLIYGTKNKTEYFTWIGPKLFNIWGKPKIKKIKTATQEESNKIYQIAENIYSKLDSKK